MLDFINGIIDLLNNSLLLVFNLIVYLFNLIIWLICGLVNIFVDIFPNSPFSNLDIISGNEKYLGYLNWLIPVDLILSITVSWGACMLVYWGYGVVMRYIKLID